MMKKDFENSFKNEIKRTYKYYRSPRYLMYLGWLSEFSSKTTNDIYKNFVVFEEKLVYQARYSKYRGDR